MTPDFCGDSPAGDAMPDPKPADGFILAAQGGALFGEWMREAGRIEIQAESPLPAPVDPALELSHRIIIPLVAPGVRVSIARVKVEPMFAGKVRR